MAQGPLVDRRCLVKAAGIAFLAGLAPRQLFALEQADAVYASAFRAEDGSFGLALISERGEIISRSLLPSRAHGVTHCRATGRVAAFARRPGTFLMVTDPKGGGEPVVVSAGQDRHFFGHGCFSPDGRFLYASENDFSANRGMTGIYDAGAGFRRIGEFDNHGIGTHDISVSDDGRMLVIANGGIETHPDFGRTKLNLDHMQPSLVLLDAATGSLIERHDLPAALRQLSTRHVDVDDRGRVWFACQYEGARTDNPPLVGSFAKGEDLTFLSLPETVTARLANYVGAIACNRRDHTVGLASPKLGYAVTIDATSGRVLDESWIRDAAGIAPDRRGFAVSSYEGQLLGTQSAVNWDQHLARLG
nr:DUF1513 domain-containing protein [uncultured Gellertiella sp.]